MWLEICQQDLKTFWVGEHIRVLGGWCAQNRHTNSVPPPHPYLVLCISIIWLFLRCILYNKQAILNKMLSWILWVILVRDQAWRNGLWESIFLAGWSEVQVAPGTFNWCVIWGLCCETELLTGGACATSGQLMIDLNWIVGQLVGVGE